MVALKFMRSHEQFMCELRSRSCLAIQKDHVVGIIKHYGGGDTGNLEVLECTAKLSWLVFLSVDSKSYVMLMLIPMPYYYNMSVTYLHAYYLDCSFHSLPLAPSTPFPLLLLTLTLTISLSFSTSSRTFPRTLYRKKQHSG